jgi:putative acetyltransferase
MRQASLTTDALAPRAEGIRHARSAGDITLAHGLFVEYARWLQVDLCFQGFQEELATLPGAYAPPRGRLLLAGQPGAAFGCIALRPLGAAPGRGGDAPGPRADPEIAEVKRLYVQSEFRGNGWGKRLARALCDEARGIGYRELKLDTLAWMAAARALYSELGFRECAPYYDNPNAGVVYMTLAL